MTLDSVLGVYLPLMREKQVNAVIFLSFMLLVSVVLMNIVTAVIVERAIQASKDERSFRVRKDQKRRAEICERLGYLFLEMDRSGDGVLQREELLDAPKGIRDKLGEVLGLGTHISDEMVP